MKHYEHLNREKAEKIFYKKPSSFSQYTNRDELKYALGATLYIPGIHSKIYEYLLNRKYVSLTTMVICLEDSIGDNEVEKAERNIEEIFCKLDKDIRNGNINEENLPILFIRTRDTEQLNRILQIKEIVKYIAGINIPKFNSKEGEEQLKLIKEASNLYETPLYAMPIIETKEVIDLRTGVRELEDIKDIALEYKDQILNIRIGATDFTGIFGIRRSIDATIYDIGVMNECISRIINYFGQADDGFVISGPVWEFFNNKTRLLKPELRQTPFKKYGEEGAITRKEIVNKAEDGLIKEVILDKVNGLTGKTVIHPSHIKLVNALQVITKEEYDDAMQILTNTNSGVAKSMGGNKMNEMKPHTNWAGKIELKSKIYGVINEDEDYTALF